MSKQMEAMELINKLWFAAEKSLFLLSRTNGKWYLEETKTEQEFHCLVSDSVNEGRLYGGTFDDGLWISEDNGENWFPAGNGIASSRVLSVAVSPTEKKNGYPVVWAGTEPSGLYRSEDGGTTWATFPNLLKLPSE